MRSIQRLLLLICITMSAVSAFGQDRPLRDVIDAEIDATRQTQKQEVTAQSSDSEFLRRIYLDLIGTIPTYSEAIAFLRTKKGLKDATFSDFAVQDQSFQTIKVQLRALGLIARSERPRSVKDTSTYWTLTPYGDTVMNNLRAVRRS